MLCLMRVHLTSTPNNIIRIEEVNLSLVELAADKIVLTLLEKDEAPLVCKTSIVTFFIYVRIWFLHFLKRAKVVLDYQKQMEQVL